MNFFTLRHSFAKSQHNETRREEISVFFVFKEIWKQAKSWTAWSCPYWHDFMALQWLWNVLQTTPSLQSSLTKVLLTHYFHPSYLVLMTFHIFWPFLTYLPNLSYSITSYFGGYLGLPYLSLYRTSLMDVPNNNLLYYLNISRINTDIALGWLSRKNLSRNLSFPLKVTVMYGQ